MEVLVCKVGCIIAVVVKLNRLVDPKMAPLVGVGTTFVALLPPCACCLRSCGNPEVSLVASLFASSIAFFLFAFQVPANWQRLKRKHRWNYFGM